MPKITISGFRASFDPSFSVLFNEMGTNRKASTYSTWGASRGNRLPRMLYPRGTPAHVTVCTWKDEEVFSCDRWARAVFGLCAEHEATLACCLMPDHLHWLLRDAVSMSRVVGQLKGRASRRLHQAGYEGPVWQRSFWDHVLRRDEDLETVARYIVANPVRRGLVREVAEYPYQCIRLAGFLG